jgi:non-reducing end alpha-L-arabinofuranosidase
MSSKTRLRVASLSLFTGVALVACSDYADRPVATSSGDPSGAASAINAAGTGGTPVGAVPTGTTPGGSTESNPMPAGISVGTNEGVGGAMSGAPIDPGVAAAGAPGAGGSGAVATRGVGPCDIYASGNTPCVGSYSVVRALSSAYQGALYQVRKGAPNALQNTGTGGETLDIGMLPNGFADGAAQAAFCGTETCTVSVVYDQSGQGNNLSVAKAGCYTGTASEDDWESTTIALTVGGNDVRGLFMEAHEGYRNNDAVATPEGQAEASVYEVAAGTASRPLPPSGCCWNFGIASRDNCYGPTGMMHALFLGTAYWGRGAGNGPWFMGDFEAGVWAGGIRGRIDGTEAYDTNLSSPSMTMNYAFGILKSRPNNYALRMGDAQQGALTTAYDGPTPTAMNGAWKLEGGIVLGIGGDNSNSSAGGTFFEGAITAGRPSDEIDEAVFQNVQAAGYGR